MATQNNNATGGEGGGGVVAEESSNSTSRPPSTTTSKVGGADSEHNNDSDDTQTRRSTERKRQRGILRKRREESSSKIDDLLGNHSSTSEPERSFFDMGKDNNNITRSSAAKASAGIHDHDTESSADEATNIFRKASSTALNYSTTSPATQPPAQAQPVAKSRSTRSQPSTQSIRRSGRVASATAGAEEDEANEHQGWWARFLSEYGSIELENKGSVARDHLALERTFLAWLRTSLAFASIGIAITQLFRLNVSSQAPGPGKDKDRYAALRSMGKPLGATFLGISILMLFIGFNRYFESQHWIIRGKFPASRGSIVVVGVVTFALMITSLVVVIVVEPGAREK